MGVELVIGLAGSIFFFYLNLFSTFFEKLGDKYFWFSSIQERERKIRPLTNTISLQSNPQLRNSYHI
jgi:hypothetical protein